MFESGGWIVRGDATQFVALFEETPGESRRHAGRAIDAALGIVRGTRLAKRWADLNLPTARAMDISIGCGIHTGEVIVARLTVGGHLVPGIAGPSAELAPRLEGRAKSLHWSIACAEATAVEAGSRFAIGQRSSLTDTDHGVVIPIVEIGGYAPAAAARRTSRGSARCARRSLPTRCSRGWRATSTRRPLTERSSVRPGRPVTGERPRSRPRGRAPVPGRGERVGRGLRRPRARGGRSDPLGAACLGASAFLDGFLRD
ncbi:MAG: hypothetical protein IPJ28_20250 [Betaproteobacteria bacterium]|nr:hypothetical protein [Betaproteobacteria bacterium]